MSELLGEPPANELRNDQAEIAIYLADQNPHRDRSLGITSMTESLLHHMVEREDISLTQVCSHSSFRLHDDRIKTSLLPLRTDHRLGRYVADSFHRSLVRPKVDVWYYPKGYVRRRGRQGVPRVGTMHDTIVQFYADRYPQTRSARAFRYWIDLTCESLEGFDLVLTVSQHAANQLRQFCDRYSIQTPAIEVTYEGSLWEELRGGVCEKRDSAVHLASRSLHKGTNRLLQFWQTLQQRGDALPELRLIGKLDDAGTELLGQLQNVHLSPPQVTDQLQQSVSQSRVLLLPSEIEGFGLPSLEAYYVGTPVCFVRGTSVAEVVGSAGQGGAFDLGDVDDFAQAFQWAMSVSSDQVKTISDGAFERFSTRQIADRVVEALSRARHLG